MSGHSEVPNGWMTRGKGGENWGYFIDTQFPFWRCQVKPGLQLDYKLYAVSRVTVSAQTLTESVPPQGSISKTRRQTNNR